MNFIRNSHYILGGVIIGGTITHVFSDNPTIKSFDIPKDFSFELRTTKVIPDLKTKDTNPKDACGTKKVQMSTVPAEVLLEVAVALTEGARKYGRHNYREIGVRGSVYYDATLRHLMAWWEGEDIDPDSDLSHITKAITSLIVLRDAMINEKWTDDRPPRICDRDFMKKFNLQTENLIKKYPNALEAYTQIKRNESKME